MHPKSVPALLFPKHALLGAHSGTVADGMQFLSVCFLSIFAASAVQSYSNGFYYTKPMSIFRRHSEEDCRVCFGRECVPLPEAKCQYYMAMSEIQRPPDDDEEVAPNNELQSKMDAMLYDFLEITKDNEAMDCIPMISTYTDCNKENQCTGCNTCTCQDGRWVCRFEECQPDRVAFSKQLMIAIASLTSEVTQTIEQSRSKRSTNNARGNDIETKITFEELAQWMNDSIIHMEETDNESATTTEINSRKTTASDPDNLAFDEVLSNIALNNNNISRKKPTLEPVDGIGDYVSFTDIVSTGINSTDEHPNKYIDKVDLNKKHSFDEKSLKVDLLQDLKERLQKQSEMENNKGFDKEMGFDFESNNFLGDINSVSIVKREVSKINDTMILQNEEIADNNTASIRDFKHNVLYPLITIINEKENELNQLLSIKNSLIDLIKRIDSNFTLDMETINKLEKNKTLFSIYKLEIIPENPVTSEDHLDTRRFNNEYDMLDTYVKKLQRDVFEIIADLRAIKQSLSSKKLPKDLELLLRGMNRYVRNQGKSYLKDYRHLNNLRRDLAEPKGTKIKRMMLEMLELCERGIAIQGSLNQFSDTTKAILQRVVKRNQIDDLVTFSDRISDPEYTLTKDLKSIGTKWPEISDNFINCSPSEKLYHLKLLHLMLTVDTIKMTDALKLLGFAQNRRVNIDTTLSDQEISRVQNGISDLNEKIYKHFQKEYEKKDFVKQSNDTQIKEEPMKKKSFLKQIKKMFKSSKKDIRRMLHKKVSKSEIVKELAKNKLGELAKQKMAQYEDTLRKWQAKLNVRSKRSAYKYGKLKNQIKNILPSYLRGKLNPAINQSKMKQKISKKHEIKHKSSKTVVQVTAKSQKEKHGKVKSNSVSKG